MNMTRIVIAATIAVTAGALVIFGSPSKPPPFGVFGWIGMACMLAAAAIGAVVRLRESLAERRQRQAGEPAVREVPASSGIQVLGTFLDEGTDRTDEFTADRYGQGGVR